MSRTLLTGVSFQVFRKKVFFELDFQSSIYRPNKTLSGQALFSVLTMRKRKMSPNPISHGKGLSFFALFAIRVKCTYYLESIFFCVFAVRTVHYIICILGTLQCVNSYYLHSTIVKPLFYIGFHVVFMLFEQQVLWYS